MKYRLVEYHEKEGGYALVTLEYMPGIIEQLFGRLTGSETARPRQETYYGGKENIWYLESVDTPVSGLWQVIAELLAEERTIQHCLVIEARTTRIERETSRSGCLAHETRRVNNPCNRSSRRRMSA